MGPEYGTEEYSNQVDIIKMRLDDCKDLIEKDTKVIDNIMVLYALDSTFSRAAICQAEKEWKSANGF